jgi:hypothetical protein
MIVRNGFFSELYLHVGVLVGGDLRAVWEVDRAPGVEGSVDLLLIQNHLFLHAFF